MPPQTIGRYNILREIGRGAMGVVYEAEDPNIGRTVALKVVNTDQIGTNREEVMRRFKNEARAAGNLNHPNIITIHDAGEHEGLLFIAMEFVKGATLAEVLVKQVRLPGVKVVDIMRQVCAGLDFAHSRGIVHRDVKPANIMITDASVKITDFGIANVGDGMTITGTVLGTPNYMSPEQVLGKPVDGRSDLFSVGVMLYQMVTGERPFEGQSITTIMYKIVHEEPIAPRKLDGTIHPGLSAVIEKALAKAPEARFQRGADLAAALESYSQPATASVTLPASPAAGVETAQLSVPALPTGAYTVRPGDTVQQTMQQAPPTVQSAPPRKRVWSTFMLGCFALVALGIVGLTAITLTAVLKGKNRKAPITVNVPGDTAGDESGKKPEPPASPAAPAPATQPPANSTTAQPGVVAVRPAPAKSASTKGVLKVDSSPVGASVLVDGKATGKTTPTSLSLEHGAHEVTVHMPGFQDASAKFTISGGAESEFVPELVPQGIQGVPGIPNVEIPNIKGPDPEQFARLQRMPGLTPQQRAEFRMWEVWGRQQKEGTLSILCASRPPGARILIDGKDTGKKTPDVVASQAGKHTVRLELPGFEAHEKVVTVGGNHPAMVSGRLQPLRQ